MTPAIAAITILSKFQNDVKNAENQIVTYCHQPGWMQLKFVLTSIGFVGGLSSSYLMPGEKVDSLLLVWVLQVLQLKPTITINGRPVQLKC